MNRRGFFRAVAAAATAVVCDPVPAELLTDCYEFRMMAYCNLELMQPGCIGRIIFSEDEAGEEASFYVTDKRTITTEGLPSGVRFSDV